MLPRKIIMPLSMMQYTKSANIMSNFLLNCYKTQEKWLTAAFPADDLGD